jgi:Predicted membrane protein
VEAGTLQLVPLELENAGTLPWHNGVFASYHWLDDRGNPIVWDGVRTQVPALAPGERGRVELRLRAPIPPGRYRLRSTWSPRAGVVLGTGRRHASRRRGRRAAACAGAECRAARVGRAAPDWAERVRAAHADGYGVVAGALAWEGGPLSRRPRALAPYEPGPGRVPGFSAPLLCPSVAPGVDLDRLDDVAGLPAFAAPRDEPWIYDGRIVLKARPRSGRRPT